jgi:hypothetical protein
MEWICLPERCGFSLKDKTENRTEARNYMTMNCDRVREKEKVY